MMARTWDSFLREKALYDSEAGQLERGAASVMEELRKEKSTRGSPD